MDYGAAFDGETDDVRIARLFQAGVAACRAHLRDSPRSRRAHPREDLGDETLEAALGHASEGPASDSRESSIALAVELSAVIGTRGTEALAAIRPRTWDQHSTPRDSCSR